MTITLLSAPRRAQRLIHSGIAALLVAGVVGCAGDSSTGPSRGNANPAGLYSLRQVGKDAIPTQIFRGSLAGIPNMTIGITGGELILDDQGTFSMALDLTMSANGQTLPRPVKFYGDYEFEGGTLALIDGAGNGVEATLRNGVITVGLDLVGNGTLKQYTFRFVP